ncbi:MAG: sigma-70 family RNA polymerase sigma factor [Acidobacteriota bacterium]
MSGRGSRQRSRWWRRKPETTPKRIFKDHRQLIERVAMSAARRAGFGNEDSEDFHSRVTLKLIENDYAVLRKHRGESSVATYLTVVINNQLRDFCNHKFGKFRHTATARRLGPTALALERLIARDRHSVDAAIEILKRQNNIEESEAQLRALADQLPEPKPPRRFLGEEKLEQVEHAHSASDTERGVVDRERTQTMERLDEVLNLALKTLSAQDLLILKMHYRDGLPLSIIATTLGLEQRPLYSRRAKCLASLKQALQAEGLTWDEVREILGWAGADLHANFGDEDSENSAEDEAPEHDSENREKDSDRSES